MKNSIGRSVSVVLLFAVAFGIRLIGISDTPLDFHPTKQYRSAMTTRAFYFQENPDIEEWRREVSQDNLRRIGIIVPAVQELVIAKLYRMTGGESIWYGRLFSVLCWVIGGAFLFLLARRLASFEASLMGTAFYLLLPFGVLSSQSFQPDPPMVGALAAALLLIVRYHERPGAIRFGSAAAAAALTVFFKPISVYFVLAGFFGAGIGLASQRGRLRFGETVVFLLAMATPSVAFYLWQILIAGFADWQRETGFVPGFIFEFRFWDGWLKRIRIAMGFTYFVGGLIGALLAQQKTTRSLLTSLWISYFVMCFFTASKISTHDYYHLPLVPVVALSLTQVFDALLARMKLGPTVWPWRAAIGSTVLLGLFLAAGTSVQTRRRVADFTPEVALAQRIGSTVRHSTSTLFLAPYYGRPLMYHGELSGESWPYLYDIRNKGAWKEPEPTAVRFERMVKDNDADYFIVLDKEELVRQPELAQRLDQYRLTSQDDEHLVFDLRSPLVSGQ